MNLPRSPRGRMPGAPTPQSFAATRNPMKGYPDMMTATKNTAAWLSFTYISFGFSVGMMVLGVWALPVDMWIKGYLSMATVSMLGASFTLAKTVRDEQEAKRFANRLEDAKAERLLMEVGRAAG